jgi:molybdate transport system ATP-binding protein
MSIEIDIVKKVSNFTLNVKFEAENERLGLLGASGCGKTITLKCIAGIMKPDSGRIVINSRTVFDSSKNINLPPQLRRTGYLFQQYALFPTMTVRQNLEIVLHHCSKVERKQRVDEMLEKLRLEDFSNQKPSQLSGGQQQRTAMGRMLVSSPEIIMLDEPLSALDSFLRLTVETELMEILANFDGTILFVSHNRDEVYRICQRMLILQDGNVVTFGTTEELFHNPKTLAAARLTGVKNIAPAFQVDDRKINVPDWGLVLETEQEIPRGTIHVAIRAHHIREAQRDEAINCFDFNVVRKQSEPFRIQEHLTLVTENTTQHVPLIRLISGAQDPIFPASKTSIIRRMCIPSKFVMVLKNC